MRDSQARSRDADALRAELRRIRAVAKVPVLFSGEVQGDTLLLSEFLGTRTRGLCGLAVHPGSGLGGASLVAGRPLSVADYRHASNITHDYDGPVLGEGIRSVLAVPVLVRGRPRAVLYSAYRMPGSIGDRTAEMILRSADRLAQEIRVRDEVDRRMRLRETHPANRRDAAATREDIRSVHAELRRLAGDPASPPAVADRLCTLADRLSQAGQAPTVTVSLSARELDVLAQVAVGCTNKEAAQRLSLRPETVKSYLRSAAAKLGTHTRQEAVNRARRARLLP